MHDEPNYIDDKNEQACIERIADLEAENKKLMQERDEENRQKRQIHGAFILTTELLAQALGFKSIEGYSTQDFIEMVKDLKAKSLAG